MDQARPLPRKPGGENELKPGTSTRFRQGTAAALLAGALLVASACSSDSGGGGSKGSGGGSEKGGGSKAQSATDKKNSDAVVAISTKDGSDNIKTDALSVTVDKGKLTSVTVKNDKGEPVEGRIGAKGRSWKPTENLAAGTGYKVHAVAKDAKGLQSVKDARFTTVTPKGSFMGRFTPEDGSTVGVGMPVSISFNTPVSDANKAAVEKHLKVTANPKTEIVGHWFGNQRLDFRPAEYWKAGTKVKLSMRLRGVEASDGIFGTQNKDVNFTVGRNQVSVVDAESKQMKVMRDGKVIKQIAITAGAPASKTYEGKMVIAEKFEVTRMNGATVGFGGEYDIKDVPHAMRLSTSGTFIHGNYWGGSAFGNVNTSHGCVGLRDMKGGGKNGSPGAWFFENSILGDVVEVTKTGDETVKPDNGLNAWNLDWAAWKEGSALK
jgi:hypothetical protein